MASTTRRRKKAEATRCIASSFPEGGHEIHFVKVHLLDPQRGRFNAARSRTAQDVFRQDQSFRPGGGSCRRNSAFEMDRLNKCQVDAKRKITANKARFHLYQAIPFATCTQGAVDDDYIFLCYSVEGEDRGEEE